MSNYYRIKQHNITPSPNNGIYITNSEKHKLLLYIVFTVILKSIFVFLKKSRNKK
ncbi:hypothetical protein SDC9_142518 [bioreactor metagenome]|uniref:Uncharacterized protein n=1 Tax=bioreactor metagenome TaxID=1076179 RepID=A0A645E0P5_9ZZZZ